MGKSSKPLRFLVHPDLYGWPEFQKLREQGHVVRMNALSLPEALDSNAQYDLVMGPNCWMMDERRRKYLDLAIQEARKLRYPKSEGPAK